MPPTPSAKAKARHKPAPARRRPRPQPFTLVQLSDTHLFADPEAAQHGWCTQASLAAVLEDIRAQHPDALLVTGDLVHDESAVGYSRLAAALHRFGVPVCYLPGNHDDPQRLQTAFAPLGEAAPARILLGGWQLLLLDDHLPGSDAGLVPQNQLDQLAYWLVRHREPALIAVHHPPVPVGSRWLDASGLRNGLTLLKLAGLHPQVRGIVCGHIHQELDMTVGGVRVLATPSTGRQFLPQSENFAEDHEALPGYRCLWLYPSGRLKTRVVRVARARHAGFKSMSHEADVSRGMQ
ncbi:MAG TPA: metallophosphoesterase [Nevskiales bacterium]|nr:metallophosphoesterase [Nevskiales bacterium]